MKTIATLAIMAITISILTTAVQADKTKNNAQAVPSHSEHSSEKADKFILNEVNALNQVFNTEYFQDLRKQYSNAILFMRYKDDQYIYIYLGFDEGTHTTRKAFVRVNSQGQIEYSEMAPSVESDWTKMESNKKNED